MRPRLLIQHVACPGRDAGLSWAALLLLTTVAVSRPASASTQRAAVLNIQAPAELRSEAEQLPALIETVLASHDGYEAAPDGNDYRARIQRLRGADCPTDELCRKKAVARLNVELIVSGSFQREGPKYVLTLTLERTDGGKPETTSESMKSLKSLRLNVDLCLNRLLPLVAAQPHQESPAERPGEPTVTPSSTPAAPASEVSDSARAPEPAPAPASAAPEAPAPAPAPESPAVEALPSSSAPTAVASAVPAPPSLSSAAPPARPDQPQEAAPPPPVPQQPPAKSPTAEVPPPSPADAKPERGLGLKVSLAGGVVYLLDPIHSLSGLRAESLLSLAWAPGGIPGELGIAAVLDNADLLALRLDLAYFLYKGPVFSHALALNLDFTRSAQYFFGGAGLTFSFEWQVWRYLAIVWTLGADFIVYPANAAPPPPKAIPASELPKAFGYLLPSSLLGLQARF
jgi:hypothetical protein